MSKENDHKLGLFGATSIGVGAIVGGGILVLGGVALGSTGPSAAAVFAVNGLIAFLTALSFAEMSTLFPESGGIYTFAKRILSIRAGFVFGWIVWFAHLVAALLYALGFAAYFAEALREILAVTLSLEGAWLFEGSSQFGFASLAVAGYSLLMMRSSSSGSTKENVVKLVIFIGLIIAGGIAMAKAPVEVVSDKFTPFASNGLVGFGQTMGLTFIALQGFEVIAGVAGEIRDPRRTIPKAMFLSLIIGLLVYIPLLIVIVGAGVPDGEKVAAWCGQRADTCFADAAQNFLGPFGYWAVVIAAIFATLSALQANLLAASRLVLRMAKDRTLPSFFGQMHKRYQTPALSLAANLVLVIFLIGVIPSIDTAGSAASLVFLIAFAFCHYLSFVARRRSGPDAKMFRTPLFPTVQIIGGLSCLSLAVFQSVVDIPAGLSVLCWMIIGFVCYQSLFSRRAEIIDAFTQAQSPDLLGYRGHTPLVLIPIANPASAASLISIGHALATHESGKVLLLKVVKSTTNASEDEMEIEIQSANAVLRNALMATMQISNRPADALLTISKNPWHEITRIASEQNCHGIVMGVNRVDPGTFEKLFNEYSGNVAIASAPTAWRLEQTKRILVPVSGAAHHDSLRAQVLGMFFRHNVEEIAFLSVIPEQSSAKEEQKVKDRIQRRADDEGGGIGITIVLKSNNPVEAIVQTAENFDLLLMGLARAGKHKNHFGEFVTSILDQVDRPTLIIGRT